VTALDRPTFVYRYDPDWGTLRQLGFVLQWQDEGDHGAPAWRLFAPDASSGRLSLHSEGDGLEGCADLLWQLDQAGIARTDILGG